MILTAYFFRATHTTYTTSYTPPQSCSVNICFPRLVPDYFITREMCLCRPLVIIAGTTANTSCEVEISTVKELVFALLLCLWHVGFALLRNIQGDANFRMI